MILLSLLHDLFTTAPHCSSFHFFLTSHSPSELQEGSWQVTKVVQPRDSGHLDEQLVEPVKKLDLFSQEGEISFPFIIHSSLPPLPNHSLLPLFLFFLFFQSPSSLPSSLLPLSFSPSFHLPSPSETGEWHQTQSTVTESMAGPTTHKGTSQLLVCVYSNMFCMCSRMPLVSHC